MLAYDIHECNHDTMRLTETGMAMVQVDGTKRQVLVELREFNKMQEILMTHDMTGEISTVRIEAAGLGTKRGRVWQTFPQRCLTV
jgi:hypothetical protein